MRKVFDVMLAYLEENGEEFIKHLIGRKCIFVCIIGVTETAKITGISSAGKSPELIDYTPPADAELLLLKRCRCIEGVPATPEGIPTPAIITLSALRLAGIPSLVVRSGTRITPQIPFIELGARAGRDIRTGKAVEDVEEIVDKAIMLGETLAEAVDYLVIGESIPGGTTTALAVMLAMGIDARYKVSSSMPVNPSELKLKVAEEGLRAAGVCFGSLADDPLKAISYVGDPVIPAFAGLVAAAARRIPVLLAGGTQMGAVLAVVRGLDSQALGRVAIGTTRWIVEDEMSDLKGIIRQIADVPILAADLKFSYSMFEGLRAYERGAVKEGVGAGGASIAAMIRSGGAITGRSILEEVEKNYREIMQGAEHA